MKKTMKTMLAFVAGALALSACSNEDILSENENVNENGAKLVTLTAYQEGEDGTRAAIDATTSTQIDWTANDKINYFGAGTGESMTLKTGAGTATGTFEGTVTTASTDYVLYPYQSTATCTAGGVITAEVPMTQYAVANSFDPAAALMVGQVNGTSVQFKNVMSFVKVTIPEGMTTCKQVSLKAKDVWTTVAGKVLINATSAEWTETQAKEGQAFVRLVPQNAEYLTAGASYYIAILPQTMATGFELIFNDDDNIRVKQSEGAGVEFGRSKTKKLGAIEWFSYEMETSALTDLSNIPTGATYSSLKISNFNIGTSFENDPGAYFAWGALRPYAYNNQVYKMGYTQKNAPYYNGSAYTKYNDTDLTPVLAKEDDIAAMLWGGNWHIPTYEELEQNTWFISVFYTSGYFNGLQKNDTDKPFFWTASLSYVSTTSPYGVYSDGGPFGLDTYYRYYGLPVRPVLAQ